MLQIDEQAQRTRDMDIAPQAAAQLEIAAFVLGAAPEALTQPQFGPQPQLAAQGGIAVPGDGNVFQPRPGVGVALIAERRIVLVVVDRAKGGLRRWLGSRSHRSSHDRRGGGSGGGLGL